MNTQRAFTQEYVEINGIQQYFLHYPAGPDSEVMLIIHGGPGHSEAPFAYYTEQQTPDVTAVYYDQRGAGKTLLKNPTDGHDVTRAQLMADLTETVAYIKKQYQKEKIVLSGHSWGSVLGLLYAQEHPEDLHFYLGAGQIVNIMKGEKEIFDRLRELAKGNSADTRKLERLGDYPYSMSSLQEFGCAIKIIEKLKKKHGMSVDTRQAQKIARKSPVFGLLDIFAMLKAQQLNRQLMEFLLTFNAESMDSFQVPVYFVHGANDFRVPVSPVKTYFENITAPDKELFLVPNAGHIINIDNPDGILSVTRALHERYINRKQEQSL